MKYQVAVLEGDGIGPEVVPAAVALAEAAVTQAGASIDWQPLPIGWKAIGECGDPMPASTKDALANTHGWIMGPHDSAAYPTEWQVSRRPMPGGELRRDYQLYANIRPAVTLDGVPATATDTDLIVLRENTEGFYVDRNMFLGHGEVMPTADVALAVGLGLAGALNAGKDHAMAQAVHGSAPDIAGKDVANPVAEMLSVLMLLRWMGIRHSDSDLQRAAEHGESAIRKTLASGVRTKDIGGEAGTKEFSDAVLDHL